MPRSSLACAFVIAAVVLGSSSAMAQDATGATLYKRGDFSGPSYTFTGAVEHINPPFIAKSVRVAPGQQWEFCTGNTYTGCRLITESTKGTVLNVRSARPARTAQAMAAAAAAAAAVYSGTPLSPSLRGVSSEFFVAPEEKGARIAAQPGSADSFCRSRGWVGSAHESAQAVGANAYLADVLCVSTGK